MLREGREVSLTMPEDMNMLEMLKSNPPFMVPFIPSVIDSVLPSSPVYEAGIRSGDRIVAMDGKPVATWSDFDEIMRVRMEPLMAGSPSHEDSVRLSRLSVVYQSKDGARTDTVTLELGADYKLGLLKQTLSAYYKPIKVDYGFWASIPAGISHGIDVLSGYVSDLKYLFTADGAKSVGSFITIGSIFPATWDWLTFWETTAFLSLMLAFMNILPIPALDGGHVLFLIAEMILRRPPSDKFLERAQVVGMALIMGLMVLACYNDIVRFLL